MKDQTGAMNPLRINNTGSSAGPRTRDRARPVPDLSEVSAPPNPLGFFHYVIRPDAYNHVMALRPGKKGGLVEIAVVWTVCICPVKNVNVFPVEALQGFRHCAIGPRIARHGWTSLGSISGLERVLWQDPLNLVCSRRSEGWSVLSYLTCLSLIRVSYPWV
jgi:hypothetical protein